jgi:hypothetical protein
MTEAGLVVKVIGLDLVVGVLRFSCEEVLELKRDDDDAASCAEGEKLEAMNLPHPKGILADLWG